MYDAEAGTGPACPNSHEVFVSRSTVSRGPHRRPRPARHARRAAYQLPVASSATSAAWSEGQTPSTGPSPARCTERT